MGKPKYEPRESGSSLDFDARYSTIPHKRLDDMKSWGAKQNMLLQHYSILQTLLKQNTLSLFWFAVCSHSLIGTEQSRVTHTEGQKGSSFSAQNPVQAITAIYAQTFYVTV